MILEWDVITGATTYRVRWRTGATYADTDKADITGNPINAYDPAGSNLPAGKVAFFKVCGLLQDPTSGMLIEGAYTAEIAFIPPPANLRWQ